MRTLGKIAATLGVIGAIAGGSVVPAAAWYGYGYGYGIATTVIIIATTIATTPTILATTIATTLTELVGRLLTPNFEAASTGGFLFCGTGVATLDYIVLAVLIAGLVVAVVIPCEATNKRCLEKFWRSRFSVAIFAAI